MEHLNADSIEATASKNPAVDLTGMENAVDAACKEMDRLRARIIVLEEGLRSISEFAARRTSLYSGMGVIIRRAKTALEVK